MVVKAKVLAAAAIGVLVVGLAVGRLVKGPGAAVPAAGRPATVAPQREGMTEQAIHDPVLNLDAFVVNVPTNWHFQGTLVQGTGCSAIPFPVFRAYAPDGLTELERLPRLDWTWSNLPAGPRPPQPGCLPLKEAMGATDFLKYLSATMELEYLSEVAVPADVSAARKGNFDSANAMAAKNAAQMHASPIVQTGEMGQAKVRYRNGTFAMEGLLSVTIDCIHSPLPDFSKQHHDYATDTCSANVRLVRAPEGTLEATLKFLDSHAAGARINPEWAQAYMQAQNRRSQQVMNQMRDSANAQMRASQQQFLQSQALHQRQHEEFLSTMQRGTDMSMRRAAQVANTNHTLASDWVDYALDQQTVRDPGTGQLSKVSSAHSYVWVDETGKTAFQTNDVNANPNGNLKGTWSLQQQVHGDGTSK
jgi:hypothetical protein